LWITFYHQSKRYRKSLGLDDTKANRKLAEQRIIPEIVYKLNSGTFFENEKTKVPTIDEFARVSFEIHKHERRPITQKRYIRLYELHIKPTFEKKRIDKIKPSQLARWQNKLLESLSSKTVKGIRTIFRTIFEDAMRDEIILRNPFALVKSPKQKEVIEKKPFSVEEIYQILDYVPEQIRAFFAIGFFTGMRTGEIIALRWSHVDFEAGMIHVRKSIRQGIEGPPKTKNSIRDIEIIDALMPYLKKHREIVLNDSIYLFETYLGKPFTTCDKISYWYWKPTLKQLGIPYRNLYQMRHTFASMMIANGEDILWVSQMLGHKDSSMTLEKYARYIKQKNRKRGVFLTRST